MRCLFTMFAEDVGLMKKGSFVRLLEDYRETPDKLHLALTDLWRCMNTGGFSPMLRTDLLRFNGGLFKDASAIEVTGDDLALLLLAAEHERSEERSEGKAGVSPCRDRCPRFNYKKKIHQTT